MVTTIISMMLFAFTGAVSPGPVNIIAANSGAIFGFYKSFSYVLGATTAYSVIVLIAGTAFNQLTTYIPHVEVFLRYLGAIFLLYMSYKIATSRTSTKNKESNSISAAPSFLEGALCQWLNPKAWLVSLSGAGLFVSSPFYLFAFCTVSFFMCLTGVGIWAAMGHLIKHWLTNEKRQTLFNRLMGLVLACSVIIMLLND